MNAHLPNGRFRLRNLVRPLTAVEKVTLALAMTWAAGFVDLVGYVSLYGLYTSHMTGNTIAMAYIGVSNGVASCVADGQS